MGSRFAIWYSRRGMLGFGSRFVDTAFYYPADISESGKETPSTSNSYNVQARSVVILIFEPLLSRIRTTRANPRFCRPDSGEPKLWLVGHDPARSCSERHFLSQAWAGGIVKSGDRICTATQNRRGCNASLAVTPTTALPTCTAIRPS